MTIAIKDVTQTTSTFYLDESVSPCSVFQAFDVKFFNIWTEKSGYVSISN